MTKPITRFEELRVRKFPYDKKVQLMRRAQKENKSLNEFLYDQLVQVADNEEVVDVRYQMKQQVDSLTQVVAVNNQVLTEVTSVLNYIAGVDDNVKN